MKSLHSITRLAAGVQAGFLLATSFPIFAAVTNPTGFVTHDVEEGVSYIAPSLLSSTVSIIPDPITGDEVYTYDSYTLSGFFETNTPIGTTVSLWDPGTLDWSTPSVYSASGWSVEYPMALGVGMRIDTPSAFSFVDTGSVLSSIISSTASPEIWSEANAALRGFYQGSGPQWHDADQTIDQGYFLIGSGSPVADHGFEEIMGRMPRTGEQIVTIDNSYTFLSNGRWMGTGYDSTDSPLIESGEAAFFNLGPIVIPEPSFSLLLALGGISLFRRKRK